MSLHITSIGSGDVLDCGTDTWIQLLKIAKQYGWIPSGTVLNNNNCDYGYCSSDLQVITAIDAMHMAQSISLALNDLRNDVRLLAWTTLSTQFLAEAVDFLQKGEVMLS